MRLGSWDGDANTMNEVETKTENRMNGNGNHRGDMAQAPDPRLKDSLPSAEPSLRVYRDEAEVYAISSALNRTGWNRKRAAQLLSISYRGLLYKIRRHNLVPPAEQT